jgi:hypothetical protein
MSDKETKPQLVVLGSHPNDMKMPPYHYQQEALTSKSVSFTKDAASMDADQKRQLRDALQNLIIA